MLSKISAMSSEELASLVERGQLDEIEALAVLRNPYCNIATALEIAGRRDLLDAHAVRERLAGFPGMPFSSAMTMITTLPWLSLLAVSQNPKAPPLVRRQAEKRLLQKLPTLALGERVALARRAHRPLMATLLASEDQSILEALLDNPRLVENDILVMVSTRDLPTEMFSVLTRHHRWSKAYRVRRAIAESPAAPLPLALSALVGLRPGDLARFAARKDLDEAVRRAAEALVEKQKAPDRGVVRSRP